MREKFKEFYINDYFIENAIDEISTTKLKKIWKDKKAIFIFDTNVLLDLYRYTGNTQNAFFVALDLIQDRIWMPFHVGIEYHYNRQKVIIESQETTNGYKNRLDKFKKLIILNEEVLKEITQNVVNDEFPEFIKIVEELKSQLNETIEKSIKDIVVPAINNSEKIIEERRLKVKLRGTDEIQDKLSDYFSSEKIGQNLYDTQDKIEKLFLNAKSRWASNIPPGFKDFTKKKDAAFYYNNLKFYKALGDLIIFNELMKYSAEKDIKNVFFITNDNKEDWKILEETPGNSRKKDLGVRYDLRRELYNNAPNVENFEILTFKEFLASNARIKNEDLSPSIIKDIDTLFYDHIRTVHHTNIKYPEYINHIHLNSKEHKSLHNKKINIHDNMHINRLSQLRLRKIKPNTINQNNALMERLVELQNIREEIVYHLNNYQYIFQIQDDHNEDSHDEYLDIVMLEKELEQVDQEINELESTIHYFEE